MRTKATKSQEQVAHALGKKKIVISQYETGRSIPPGDILVKLAQYFEVSIDDFVLRDIEKEGTSGDPVKPTPQDEALTALLARMENYVAALEGNMEELRQQIRDKNPELAKELGIG
ncbi:MAG: helix-turn-helix transcriptional regulator [Saprospiraceae bacterium]|nr:helix-turn-helix transcriptional regulator [Saprospiraceae bacterium]